MTPVWIRQSGKALENRGTSMKLAENTFRKRTVALKEKLGFDDYFRYYLATPQLNECDARRSLYEKL